MIDFSLILNIIIHICIDELELFIIWVNTSIHRYRVFIWRIVGIGYGLIGKLVGYVVFLDKIKIITFNFMISTLVLFKGLFFAEFDIRWAKTHFRRTLRWKNTNFRCTLFPFKLSTLLNSLRQQHLLILKMPIQHLINLILLQLCLLHLYPHLTQPNLLLLNLLLPPRSLFSSSPCPLPLPVHRAAAAALDGLQPAPYLLLLVLQLPPELFLASQAPPELILEAQALLVLEGAVLVDDAEDWLHVGVARRVPPLC